METSSRQTKPTRASNVPWAVAASLIALYVLATVGSAATTFTSNPPVIDPAYAGSYVAVDIGRVPVTPDIGAIQFKDANTLLIDVNTYQPSAELDAVGITRDAQGHITGFTGAVTKFANAPYIDGGLQYGLGGVLFYTSEVVNQLGQIKPGGTGPSKTTDLGPLGVAGSVGPMSFVPRGFGGAGLLKVISWDAETWYSTFISPDGTGTFTPGPFTATALPPVNWEGMAFIAAGQPLFPVNSVIINADLKEAVYAFELDSHGNPIIATQKHFMDVSDPVGMAVDPVTGDILITTEQGPLGNHIAIVRGFTPVTPPPAATVSTDKAAYTPQQPILASFTNTSGLAHEWVGLFAAGTPNTAYLQWFYTDGTETGTAGFVNGSVGFASGLPGAGNYEARLFFDGGYALQAVTAFTVEDGPPTPAGSPNPSSGSIDASLNPTLTWSAGAGATSHAVYFGTNPTPGAAQFKGTQATTGYVPGTLAPQTTYYWRIDESNTKGTTSGDVWSFTTASTQSTPTVSTNKGTFLPGETIVASFTNASGAASDWIGLFAAGAPSTAYLDWRYAGGTQVQNVSGVVNGSVTFSGGLPADGNYEVRLFFHGTYAVQATASFTVGNGGSLPSIATTKGAYQPGETIVASFTNASGAASDWIGLFAAGTPNTSYLDWRYAGGTQVQNVSGVVNGSVTFPNGLPAAGNYEVRLFFGGTYVLRASSPFVVQSGSPPTIATDKSSYVQGETIVASFAHASGSARDWVGVFVAGSSNTAYLDWLYVDGTQTGTTAVVNGSVAFSSAARSPGTYEVRLFKNDTYVMEATTTIVVQSQAP